MILLLFNSINQILFELIQPGSELPEAFIKDNCHTTEQITYLLGQGSSERGFELGFHSLDGCFCVPLAGRVEGDEGLLQFQDFSDDHLHFMFGLLVLALNNVVIFEKFADSFMHLNERFSYRLRDFRYS